MSTAPEADEPEGRRATHGEFERTAMMAVAIRDALVDELGDKSKPAPVMHALDMICTKLARIAAGDPTYVDHWRDIAGYASLVANWLASQKEPGRG